MTIERPVLPLARPREVWRHFSGLHAGNAIVGFVFAASGPVAIILSVGLGAGLSESDLASWIFGCFFVNGLLTILFSLIYRQPLCYFWTIPGTVLVGPALQSLTFPEVIGAFYATGILMLVLGFSGWIRRAMTAIPMPIVMGMVAGVFLKFGLDLVYALRDGIWIAAPMVVAFFALSALPRLARRLPPLIGALLVGLTPVFALGEFGQAGEGALTLALPNLQVATFSWQAIIELVVPLAITVLVVQNGQGFAVLTAAGHEPPVNAITVACGAGALASALFGAVSTCLTGPVNAILSGGGDRKGQYTAGIMVGLLALIFAAIAPVFTRFMLATPPTFIAVIAGLAMLRVLQAAFIISFKDRFTLGALVAFLITVADVSITNIGAPFWGLLFGLVASLILEREHFRRTKPEAKAP